MFRFTSLRRYHVNYKQLGYGSENENKKNNLNKKKY